jgi:hypothetical protein
MFHAIVLRLNHNNMRKKIKLVALVLVSTFACAQKQSVPATPGSSNATAKAVMGTAQPNYLTVPLDINTGNLGPGFAGNDIVGIYKALKNVPGIAPRGEFETTEQFEQRTSEMAKKPILGSIALNDHFAFVISREMVMGSLPLQLTYDADLRLLQADFSAEYADFSIDPDKARRTAVLLRQVENGPLPGSTTRGSASIALNRHPDYYSISLARDWLFQPGKSQLSFSHLMDVAPEEAKLLKDDLRAVLVCRITPPWTRRKSFGYASVRTGGLFNVYYLEVVPEQLWIYNSRTGEVVEQITEESLSKNKDQQLALKLRQTPLVLELSSANFSSAFLTVDGVPRGSDTFHKERPLTVTAKREIEIMIAHPRLSELDFRLNGQPYSPQWKKASHLVGSQEFVDSVTAVITAPAR